MTPIEKFKQFYVQLGSKDISGLKDVYSADVEFIDPIAVHHGIDTVYDYFQKLLHGTRECEFIIHSVCDVSNDTERTTSYDYVVEWQMRFTAKKLKANNTISVDGVTLLKTNATHVTYHRDYYDMGQLVYEHIPLLGRIIRYVKEQLK